MIRITKLYMKNTYISYRITDRQTDQMKFIQDTHL